MAREEAMKVLEEYRTIVMNCLNVETPAFDTAIEALRTEPVCEHFYKGYCGKFEDGCFRQCQAEPKHGEWVAAHIGETTSWYVECSECHVVMPPVNYSFCPNCGAKMKG